MDMSCPSVAAFVAALVDDAVVVCMGMCTLGAVHIEGRSTVVAFPFGAGVVDEANAVVDPLTTQSIFTLMPYIARRKMRSYIKGPASSPKLF